MFPRMRPDIKYSDVASDDTGSHPSLDGLEKLGFLSGEESPPSTPTWRQRLHTVSRKVFLIALPWTLVVLLAGAMVTVYHSPTPACAEWGIEKYSPAGNAIEYHDVVFKRDFGLHAHSYSEFTGWPSDEIDARWDELYQFGATLHMSDSENSHLLNKSVHTPVPGFEDTYVGGLDVFHQLHCLNTVRKYFYPARYNTSVINPDGSVNYTMWIHLDHCIDSLRQSLMCSADVAVNAFEWLPTHHYLRSHLNSVHRCRNFDKIKEWAWARWVTFDGHQLNVEEGRVVDYAGKTGDPERVENRFEPDGWNHRAEDMYDYRLGRS